MDKQQGAEVSGSNKVDILLSRWDVARQHGQTLSPEELCRDCPQHLAELQSRIDGLQMMERFMAKAQPEGGDSANSGGTSTLQEGTGGSSPMVTSGIVVPGYEILGELGRGGMGVVYKTRQVKLNRIVALKMILAGSHAGEHDLARFRIEAEAVGRLQHPNIVQIFEVGEHEGRPFFSLEYVDGGNLAQKLNGTPLPPIEAARLVETLARAMHAAHQRGIVHRDLKPGNVLLQNDERRMMNDERKTGSLSIIPKITDFGLAKRLDVEAGQTQSGAVMGTPSYMAPEQARGETRQVGPAADVYALGAILYECLTGRPPFRAPTTWDTVAQVLNEEPAPPRRLQAKVPRDLETICLKCLRKEAKQRYDTAVDLAEDLGRYLAGEPIRARPVGGVERAVKWARKRPAAAALSALSVLVATGIIAALFWYQQFRLEQAAAETLQATRSQALGLNVTLALDDAGKIRKELQSKLAHPVQFSELISDIDGWHNRIRFVRAAWERADKLGQGNADLLDPVLGQRIEQLREQLTQDEADWKLAKELDDIRLEASTLVEGRFDKSKASPKYAKVFERLRLPVSSENPEQIAGGLHQLALRYVMVAALDHWAEVDPKLRSRLLAVSQKSDPDPWRDQVRDPRNARDRKVLEKLARQMKPAENSPQVLMLLATLLRDQGADAQSLLRQAVNDHPRDFWLYFDLGTVVRDPGERVGCFQTVVAIRQSSSAAHYNLGVALRNKKDLDGAIAQFKKAIGIDPKNTFAYIHLGVALRDKNDLEGAIAQCKKAIELDAKNSFAYNNLGLALYGKKDLEGAIAAYKKAIEIEPKFSLAHSNLGMALRDKNDLDGAIAQFKKAIETDPKNSDGYSGLGAILRDNKDLDGAIAQFKKAVEIDPESSSTHYNLGLALLDKKNTDLAIGHFREALKWEPNQFASHIGLGFALCQKKQFDEAARHLQRAIRINPADPTCHGLLAECLLEKGEFAEARQAGAKCVELTPAANPLKNTAQQLVMRCDHLMALDRELAGVLQGKEAPKTGKKLLALVDLCRKYKHYYWEGSRLYAAALAEEAALGEQHRFEAARLALLAAAGKGRDPKPPADADKSRLRAQALEWLRMDLARWEKVQQDRKVEGLLLLLDRLPGWRSDPDLAGVRDADAVARLPAGEQTAWQALWAKADRVSQEVRAGVQEKTLTGKLTATVPRQFHELKMLPARTYVLDLISTDFDTYLQLLDGSGKILAENDDLAPDNLNSRLILMVKQPADYRISATSFQQRGQGAYTLTVREFIGNAAGQKK